MKQILENKKGAIPVLGWLAIIVVLLIAGGIGFAMIPQEQVVPTGTTEAEVLQTAELVDQAVLKTCPSDNAWSGTFTTQNKANTTGSQTFDETANFYEVKVDGSEDALGYDAYNRFSTPITDTTSGAVTLTCAKRYAVKTLSVSGAGGDPSRFRELIGTPSGVKNAKVNDAGVLIFTAVGDRGAITAGAWQTSLIENRVYDFINVGYIDHNSSGEPGTINGWNATTLGNWSKVGNNTLGTDVGSGGEYHIRLEIRSAEQQRDVNDNGVYALVEASTSTFDSPTVKIDNVVVSDVKDTGLNPDEVKAYATYEYAYLISPDKKMRKNTQVDLDFDIFASGGQNPDGATDLKIDLASRGSFASVSDGNLYKSGSVDDSSSRVAIHTLKVNAFTLA